METENSSCVIMHGDISIRGRDARGTRRRGRPRYKDGKLLLTFRIAIGRSRSAVREDSGKVEAKVSAICGVIGADEVIGDDENVVGHGRPVGGGAQGCALFENKSVSPGRPGEDKLIAEQSELQRGRDDTRGADGVVASIGDV
jgi:hypothetical protein